MNEYEKEVAEQRDATRSTLERAALKQGRRARGSLSEPVVIKRSSHSEGHESCGEAASALPHLRAGGYSRGGARGGGREIGERHARQGKQGRW